MSDPIHVFVPGKGFRLSNFKDNGTFGNYFQSISTFCNIVHFYIPHYFIPVAPHVIEPAVPETKDYLFNSSTTVSCTFTARPQLNDNSVAWYKDGQAVNSTIYIRHGEVTSGEFPYGMEEGWRSDLTFTPPDVRSCTEVTFFDGLYHCGITASSGQYNSPTITLTVLCKYCNQCGVIFAITLN